MKPHYASLKDSPSPKREYTLEFTNLTGGLNLWELDYRLRRSESPEMKNLIWREGTLNCRDGQIWLDDTARGTARAMAERSFHGKTVFHAGTKLWAFDPASGTASQLRSGLPQNAGSFFVITPPPSVCRSRGALLFRAAARRSCHPSRKPSNEKKPAHGVFPASRL